MDQHNWKATHTHPFSFPTPFAFPFFLVPGTEPRALPIFYTELYSKPLKTTQVVKFVEQEMSHLTNLVSKMFEI